jgi:hypothetical protein
MMSALQQALWRGSPPQNQMAQAACLSTILGATECVFIVF